MLLSLSLMSAACHALKSPAIIMEDNEGIEDNHEENEGIEDNEGMGDNEIEENQQVGDEWIEDDEDAEWIEKKEDIEKLKIRVSIYRNLESLENLCLAKVANDIISNASNTRMHTTQFGQDPWSLLELLPPVVMRALPKFLQASKFSPVITSYLVNRNTESLKVNTSTEYTHRVNGWSLEDQMSILERIQFKGKNITELDLVLGFPCTPQLASTLHSLGTKLTQLRLSYAGTDDAVLAVIGSCCPQLRKLILDATHVTDAGLGYLCVSDDIHGKCKKLTYLNMSGLGRITVAGLVTALKNLPELLVLQYCVHLYSAILQYASETHNSPPLKLQCLIVGVEENGSDTSSMATVVSAVPDTRSLTVCSIVLQNVDQFLKLTEVVELRFGYLCSLSLSNMMSLIINSSSKLTKLVLFHSTFEIDISIIGLHCTNLENLDLVVERPIQLEHNLVPFVHFSKLEKVGIFNGHSHELPDIVMKCFLSATSLQDVQMCSRVSDSVFGWLIEEARRNELVFSNLSNLFLISDISPLRIKQILCFAPKLKTVFIPHCPTHNIAQSFFQRHGLTHCRVL